MRKNIQPIINNALCTACGGCSGICPVGAISMVSNTAGYIVPNIDYGKCTYCAKCYHICPSVSSNTPQMDCVDPFHGKFLEGYVGYATDKNIRQEAQSGGIVTALLCYLLKTEAIDGAIVNHFNPKTKRPRASYVESTEGIQAGSGSYYAQSSVVAESLKHQDKRTAAVVLGCQGECINLIKQRYPQMVLPEYLIGLICAGQYSGNYIDKIIQETKCKKDDVIGFRFRDKKAGGWPGDIKIATKNKEYRLNKVVRHTLKPVYEANRCLLCFDQMNIFADLVAGDPWGITNKMDKAGNTVIIARTEKGKKLIENAFRDGIIYIEKLPVSSIVKGQTVDSRLKTQFFTACSIAKEKGYMLPFEMDYFKDIPYTKGNKQKYKSIKSRLEFSRSIYLEKDEKKYKKLICKARVRVKVERKLRQVIKLPKRICRYALRKIAIGNNR